MRIAACRGYSNPRNTNRWTHKLIDLTGKTFLVTFLPHLRSVDKFAFLLVRVDATSPMKVKYMVKIYS